MPSLVTRQGPKGEGVMEKKKKEKKKRESIVISSWHRYTDSREVKGLSSILLYDPH